MLIGIRVTAAEEITGLDLVEMGMEAYPGGAEVEAKIQSEVSIGPAAGQPARL